MESDTRGEGHTYVQATSWCVGRKADEHFPLHSLRPDNPASCLPIGSVGGRLGVCRGLRADDDMRHNRNRRRKSENTDGEDGNKSENPCSLELHGWEEKMEEMPTDSTLLKQRSSR